MLAKRIRIFSGNLFLWQKSGWTQFEMSGGLNDGAYSNG